MELHEYLESENCYQEILEYMPAAVAVNSSVNGTLPLNHYLNTYFFTRAGIDTAIRLDALKFFEDYMITDDYVTIADFQMEHPDHAYVLYQYRSRIYPDKPHEIMVVWQYSYFPVWLKHKNRNVFLNLVTDIEKVTWQPPVYSPGLMSHEVLSDLTFRENRVLYYYLYGYPDERIAQILFIKKETVKSYKKRICNKLGTEPGNLYKFCIDAGIRTSNAEYISVEISPEELF